MNIFALHTNPRICAKQHNDKHVVKMVTEYGQLLSTCHRSLDGIPYYEKSKNNRNIKRYRLNDEREYYLYKSSHENHPNNKWLKESDSNYMWLYELWVNLANEYTHRYGKVHATYKKLDMFLNVVPNNIKKGKMTKFALAMPDYCKHDDPIKAYHNYYMTEKRHIAKWKNRDIPEWFY